VTWGEEGGGTGRDETAEGTRNGDGCVAWSQDEKGAVTTRRLWAVARRRRDGCCGVVARKDTRGGAEWRWARGVVGVARWRRDEMGRDSAEGARVWLQERSGAAV
jgi:hypothetical protein